MDLPLVVLSWMWVVWASFMKDAKFYSLFPNRQWGAGNT